MYCPFCKHIETKVTDTRDSEGETRRRRECLKCERRFTTYERVEPLDLRVIKKDGSIQQFSREKLRGGIMKALERRPVKGEEIDKMLIELEDCLAKKGKEVTTKEIGECVMKKLKKVDKVAYIRFASVYKDFREVEDFKDAIKEVS